MWDTDVSTEHHLSRDLPCIACGHAGHTYLPCSDSCACTPPPLPGGQVVLAGRLTG